MTAFLGRLAAVSLSGAVLMGVLLLLLPVLRTRPALMRGLYRLVLVRMLVPVAPLGQQVLRACLSALPAPEGGFYLTAYRLAEFGAAQVVAFLWLFGACAVLGPMVWEQLSGRQALPRTLWERLRILVCAVHWFNPLLWRFSRGMGEGEASRALAGKGGDVC